MSYFFTVALNRLYQEGVRDNENAEWGMFSGTSGIRRSAAQRANQFCKNIDKNTQMVTISEHTAAPPYILGNFPRIEIIFVCTEEPVISREQTSRPDKYDKLAKIKKLQDNGVLTEEEFEKEKKIILNSQ